MTTIAPVSTDTAEHSNIPAGIGLMLLAVFLFSLNDALGKWMAQRYAAPQILLFRSTAALLVLTPIILRRGIASLTDVTRPRLQLARALLSAVETGMFYAAVRTLPLADAMTFYLAGPIYVTLLATIFLGEKIGWRRWAAILVGFAGVVIALRPSSASFTWPTLIALGGSMIYAVFMVITRSLRGTPDAVMATWQILAALTLGIVTTPFVWRPVEVWYDTLLLAVLGIAALGAIICVNRSLKLAPASVVVPYQYMMIVWAGIFGYLFFGDIPHTLTIVGAIIIVGAGLFIFFREKKLGQPIEPELPPER